MELETYLSIKESLAQIIKGSQWENHIFMVGGCIRDQIMEKPIHDIDIAVDLVNGGIAFVKWLEKRHFAARGRSVQIFSHFGTAKIRLRQFPEQVIDCVQTRRDKYIYEDKPNPEANFGTIYEDAIRRDLTINSLYLNISTGQLLDPSGMAIQDIESHIIRTPNSPDITLTDNPMHVLRCIRFAVRLGWSISQELMESIKRNVNILAESTKSRLLREVASILDLQDKDAALSLIEQVGAMPYVAPAIEAVQEMRRLGIPLESQPRRRAGHNIPRKSNSRHSSSRPRRRRRNNSNSSKDKE